MAKKPQKIIISDCTPPFSVSIFTDDLTDNNNAAGANTDQSRGLCLEYTQVPC